MRHWIIVFLITSVSSALHGQDSFVETHLSQLESLLEADLRMLGEIRCSYVRDGREIQTIVAAMDEPNRLIEFRDKMRKNQSWDGIRNSEYYAVVRVEPSNPSQRSVTHLTTNTDDDWEKQIVRMKLPFYSALLIGKSTIPEIVRSGAYTVSRKEELGVESYVLTASEGTPGPHHVVLKFGLDSKFPILVTSFFDDSETKGSRTSLSEFKEIGGINFPEIVEFELFVDDQKESTKIEIKYDPSSELVPARCNLEYYDVEKPDMQLANQGKSRLTDVFVSALGLILISGCIWFYLRKRDHETVK
jgi:hypothetical protein